MTDTMARRKATPCVSVLMPAYNAERFIRGSVYSVLGQTFGDFELIVVNDGSSDATGEILERLSDPRLRVIHNGQNLRAAQSLNEAAARARGRYIARIDADDFCLPVRLAKQKAFLDSHPEILLVGSEMFNLEADRVIRDPRRGELDPLVIRWAFNVGNEIGGPSVMFRSSLLDALGCFMRPEFDRAEDYDFAYRVLRLGDICTMPEPLGIYRRHTLSVSHARSHEVSALTIAILSEVHAEVLGDSAGRAALLIVRHFMGGEPVREAGTMRELGALLDRLLTAFLDRHRPNAAQQERIAAHASQLWWRVVKRSLRAGTAVAALRGCGAFAAAVPQRPSWRELAAAGAYGLIPGKPLAARFERRLTRQRSSAEPGSAQRESTPDERDGFIEIPEPRDEPCSVYVVVEGCGGPAADPVIAEVQAVCDRYGARPLYLSEPFGDGLESPLLRRIFQRRAGAVGVRLDTGPDFDLTARRLTDAAGSSNTLFGLAPLFFGCSLADKDLPMLGAAVRHGFAVGVALPGRLSAKERLRRAPGYSLFATFCWLGPQGIRLLSLGPGPAGNAEQLRQGDLASLDRKTENSAVRSAARRGCRTFTLHIRAMGGSASASRNADGQDADELVRGFAGCCRFFFDEFGALPGNPADLLPGERRHELWQLSGTRSNTPLAENMAAAAG